MHVLLVDAYDRAHRDAHIATSAANVLRSNGNSVEVLGLHELGFTETMSVIERQAYETDVPLISENTIASARALEPADALVFCYPTVLFGVPPVLKSWMERVLVQGVAFSFDRNGRLRPGMSQVRRLGAITTTPHSAAATRTARDLGRRSIMWTVRLNCHRFCRRSFVRLNSGIDEQASHAKIATLLARW